MIRFALVSTVVSMGMVALSGCSGLLKSEAPPVQVYVLRAAVSPTSAANAEAQALDSARTAAANLPSASPVGAPSTPNAPPSLQVPRPQADPGLATELITLVRSDHRMDRYAASSWAGSLPDVVETLAIDTLRASGNWASVHDAPSPFAADYLLQITIRRFEADYTSAGVGAGTAPKVYVTLDCTIARRIGRELLTSFVAEGVADAEADRMSAVVAAFEKAANTALASMAERSAAAIRMSTGPSTP
jgi:cholesterol transport system auxiliary component